MSKQLDIHTTLNG
jgi:hypothetical protein